MHKSLPQFLAATWVVYAAFHFCVNDQACAYPVIVESESRLFVQQTKLQGRTLDLRLLDESQRGIKKAKIKLSVRSQSGQTLFAKELLTGNFGEAQVDLDLKPGDYFLRLDHQGDKNTKGSSYEGPYKILACEASLKLSLTKHLWWPKSKPIEIQLDRSLDCLELELPIIASFGPFPAKRFNFAKGQAQLDLVFDAAGLEDDAYLLTLESLDDAMFFPYSTSVSFFVYEKIFESTAVWRRGYYADSIDVFASHAFLKPDQSLPELEAFASLTDAHGRSLVLRTKSDGAGLWTFALPEGQWEPCVNLEIWPEGQRVLTQNLLVCKEHTQDIGPKLFLSILLALGLLILSVSLWGLWRLIQKRSRKPKMRLPKPHIIHKEAVFAAPISRLLGGLRPVESRPCVIELVVVDEETKIHIPGLKLELWRTKRWEESSQTATSSSFKISLQDALSLRLSHLDYMTWEGMPKRQLDVMRVEMMTRRKYVILCFEAVSQRLLSQASPWGSISPARVAALPRDSQNTSEEIVRFCALVEVAVFSKTSISYDEIDEIYEIARKCLL